MELKSVMEEISKDIADATRTLFETMIMIDLKFNNAAVVNQPYIKADVAGLISFMGKYHGLIGLFCSRKFSLQIASGMLMEELKAFTPETIDAIGEVSNMIAGNVKTKITADYGEMILSIPIILVGGEPTCTEINSLPVSCFTKDPWLITNFSSGDEVFNIGLLLKETK
ncbi:MAG: chemotaxis protein CheX [Planctomycetes bacterium]|nr:chemotaxis protein CheX [Planctomycetota bacterium]